MGRKASRINYYFKNTLENADTFLHMFPQVDKYYKKSLASLTGEENQEIIDKITALGYEDVKINMIDEQNFFGLGLKVIDEPLESRLEKLFHEYKKKSAYESLYYLILKIGYLLEMYAYNDHPIAVVKFNGFKDKFLKENEIRIVYPLYFYIESK